MLRTTNSGQRVLGQRNNFEQIRTLGIALIPQNNDGRHFYAKEQTFAVLFTNPYVCTASHLLTRVSVLPLFAVVPTCDKYRPNMHLESSPSLMPNNWRLGMSVRRREALTVRLISFCLLHQQPFDLNKLYIDDTSESAAGVQRC